MNILKDFISLVINKLNTLLDNEITRATAEESRLDTAIQDISTELSTDYQKKLVAGENITIDPDTNEISASGGGGGDKKITFMVLSTPFAHYPFVFLCNDFGPPFYKRLISDRLYGIKTDGDFFNFLMENIGFHYVNPQYTGDPIYTLGGLYPDNPFTWIRVEGSENGVDCLYFYQEPYWVRLYKNGTDELENYSIILYQLN